MLTVILCEPGLNFASRLAEIDPVVQKPECADGHTQKSTYASEEIVFGVKTKGAENPIENCLAFDCSEERKEIDQVVLKNKRRKFSHDHDGSKEHKIDANKHLSGILSARHNLGDGGEPK